MKLVYNPFTDEFDYILSDTNIAAISDLLYLKLDQTTPQNVINGLPQFNEGVTITTDKRIYLDGI